MNEVEKLRAELGDNPAAMLLSWVVINRDCIFEMRKDMEALDARLTALEEWRTATTCICPSGYDVLVTGCPVHDPLLPRQNVDTCEDVSAACHTETSTEGAAKSEESVSERTKVHDTCSSVQDKDALCADGHAMEDALRTDCTATGDETPDFPTQENDGIQESAHTPEDDSRGCELTLVDQVARGIAEIDAPGIDSLKVYLWHPCARAAILKVADWLEDVPPHERTGLLPEDLLRAEVEK